MALPSTHPLIIVKKKKRHAHGHHGGAWKVAYADFVTAMLSLFIVLWLLSSSETVQKAVGGYFTDPKGSGKDVGNGLKGAGGESLSIRKDEMSKIKDKLEQAVHSSAALDKIKEHVIFTMTGEGLRIELVEGESSTFFESANSNPTDFGKDLLGKLAQEIGKLPNKVTMEGHTDSRPYPGGANYTNWELSSDRANAARRWMASHGMRDDQVTQVRGFADQNPRDAKRPDDAMNRRVTLVIQYQPVTAATPETPPADAAGKPAAGKPAEGKPAPSQAAVTKPPATPPAKR